MEQENRGIGRRGLLAGVAAGIGGTALATMNAAPALADDIARPAAPTAVAVTPSDPQYADLTAAFNPRWTATPDVVYVVDNVSEIAPILQSAVSANKKLTVRSGGHCFENFVYNGSVKRIIDMTNLNDVYYDAGLKAIAVEPGAIVLDVYKKLFQTWGVTLPGGVCYSVGMGGHVAGGGWGWLVRRNGLIVDHLYAVEVATVSASGQVKTILATREANDPNRDLWWAHTGGGGGNFGIVTRYYFKSPGATGSDPRNLLPKPPKSVLFGIVQWSLNGMTQADFTRLIKNFGDWHVANRGATNPNRLVMGVMQAYHKSADKIQLLAFVDGEVSNASTLLNDFFSYLKTGVSAPVFSAIQPMPWLLFCKVSGTTNGLLNDPTQRAKYKSVFMRQSFNDTQLAALYRALTSDAVSNPNINLNFTGYGGVTSAVPQSATSIPHREAAFKVLWSAQWADPAQDDANIAWVRNTYADVFSATGGVPVVGDQMDGCYINYCDVDMADPNFNRSNQPWSQLYYKDAYPRLQAAKKKYDPRNFFTHSLGVELPG